MSVCTSRFESFCQKLRIRTTLCGNALEKILGYGLILALEWFDEDYSVVWLGLFGVEALNAERHGVLFL